MVRGVYLFNRSPNQSSNEVWVEKTTEVNIPKIDYWQAPSDIELEQNPDKETILYGKDLIVNTSKCYGLQGVITKNSTNGMNCQNCHLEAGTKIFGNNYSGFAANFPIYRARSG